MQSTAWQSEPPAVWSKVTFVSFPMLKVCQLSNACWLVCTISDIRLPVRTRLRRQLRASPKRWIFARGRMSQIRGNTRGELQTARSRDHSAPSASSGPGGKDSGLSSWNCCSRRRVLKSCMARTACQCLVGAVQRVARIQIRQSGCGGRVARSGVHAFTRGCSSRRRAKYRPPSRRHAARKPGPL